MHTHVKEMMKQLIETPIPSMPLKISEVAQRRWIAGSDDGPMV
jgi:hypothetical protein